MENVHDVKDFSDRKLFFIYIPFLPILVSGIIPGRIVMKCHRCGKRIHELNHFYVPLKNRREGVRLCIECARRERIITLV
jgi:hypothetical protein